MVKRYIPEQGDIVWIELDPTKGHEQQGRRPALVLSRGVYNTPSHLMQVAPITSHPKGYPFEVAVHTKKIQGVILADQLRSLDWSVRGVTLIAKAPPEVVSRVRDLCVQLLSE
jgi:mRNA interferase MazF